MHGATPALRLDHLESFVRSGSAHGRTREAPPDTLRRLRLVDGAVDTAHNSADYLAELVVGEAWSQSARPNIVTTGVMRHLAEQIVTDLPPAKRAEVAALTDHEFWSLLLAHPAVGPVADALRRDPAAWHVVPFEQGSAPPAAGTQVIEVQLSRLYVDLPLVDGRPMTADPSRCTGLPTLPRSYQLRRRS